MSWEVRTMKSATSCSNWFYPALWKKNMARFWPIWAVYLACFLFAMPLNLLTGFSYDRATSLTFAREVVRSMATWPAMLAALVFGVVAAMAVFSYLYQAKSAGMLHALPVRREGLFLTNYLSGLSFMVLPTLAVFVLTLLCELARGAVDATALGAWLLAQVLNTLFFYSFAVFCAMFTGHILALPVFYGILNGLALGLYYLIYNVVESFVFGFAGSSAFNQTVMWLTPTVKLSSEVRVFHGEQNSVLQLRGMGYLMLYAAVGLVLAALALVLYRRRKLEGAGDIVTVGWVRPVFKYGVAFSAAMSLGSFLYAWFGMGNGNIRNMGAGSAWVLLAFLLVCGAVGYFAAEMLLKKSFRIFSTSWKGLLVFALCMTAAMAVLELDLTGFERRVPDPNQVVQVRVSSVRTYPSDSADWANIDTQDPEVIRAVTELHAAITARKAEYEREDRGSRYEEQVTSDGLHVDAETMSTDSVHLTYITLSGAAVQREYDVPFRAEDLDTPGTPGQLLTALVNRPQDKVASYFPKYLDDWRLVDISLDSAVGDGREGYGKEAVSVPTEWRDRLMEAVRSDLAAGRLGVRYLLDDMDRMENCYYNDLQFSFHKDSSNQLERGGTSVTVTLQKTATDTMRVLEDMGLLDEVDLMTRAEVQASYWQIQQSHTEQAAERDTVRAEPVY